MLIASTHFYDKQNVQKETFIIDIFLNENRFPKIRE
jgi:hypothetical protein